jgi:hypothetical protein
MFKYVSFLAVLLFSNCTFQYNEDTSATTSAIQDSGTIETAIQPTDFSLFDSLKITKLKEYAPIWNAACFPMPEPVILKRTVAADRGYLYLINSFDSLSSKISTEKERSAGSPCSWKQEFKSGITYSTSTCAESGTTYIMHTSCPDKHALVSIVDIIFQNDVNDWNSDSTRYEPILENAGCYYSIEQNTDGNYDLKYSCSY